MLPIEHQIKYGLGTWEISVNDGQCHADPSAMAIPFSSVWFYPTVATGCLEGPISCLNVILFPSF